MNLDEALNLLRGGPDNVKEWNSRTRRGDQIPNLQGVDLREAILFDVFLAQANLNGANLRGADLNQAMLHDSSLVGADLRGAKLCGADLSVARLGGAKMSEADLSDAFAQLADLRGANLYRANLGGANFFSANLGWARMIECDLTETNLTNSNMQKSDIRRCFCHFTMFGNLDLSEVNGLETVRHIGPSIVDVGTLFHSRGQIPEVFLRGCGVPEPVILNLASMVTSMAPIQFYSCFLSHSSADKDFARRLHSRMTAENLRVWFDEKDMQGGRKLHEQIDEAIRVFDKLLLVLSPTSMNSEWVRTELRKAFKLERREGTRKLFPIGLVPYSAVRDWECFDADHGKDLAVEVREYFIPDFSSWKDEDAFEAAFTRLLNDLKAEGPPAGTS